MFDIAACLDWQPLPAGRRVAIVTNAGGPGILAVDACVDAGLDVVEFGDGDSRPARRVSAARSGHRQPGRHGRVGRRRRVSPHGRSRHDVGRRGRAPRDLYARRSTQNNRDDRPRSAMESLPDDEPGRRAKQCWRAYWPNPERSRRSNSNHRRNECRCTRFLKTPLVRSGKLSTYAGWRSQPPALFWSFDDIHAADARELCRAVLDARGADWLTGEETRRVLHDFGVPLVETVVAHSADEAAALGGEIRVSSGREARHTPAAAQDRRRRRARRAFI